MTSDGNLDDMIEKAEAERFVGREYEMESFRQHINRIPPNYIFFYISGQGGVGKTTLLNRFRTIARREFGMLIADCDERQRDVPTVLGHFAQQLSQQNAPLKHFNERYRIYRQKLQEIENDPAAPQGLATLVVRGAFAVGDAVPVLRKGLEFLPEDSLANQVSEWTGYLAKKLSNKDDIALVRDPVAILTPLFFGDLNEITQKQKVLLSFENFEATRPELQQWLSRLQGYKVSQNIRFVIAGRHEAGIQWETLRLVTMRIPLDVLTEPEAESFLNMYGIADPLRRSEILASSDRLPVIMSWLAAPEGKESNLALPTHSIVDRFLRWVDDPTLRNVALVGAIPRTFNADTLKLLLDKQHWSINEQRAFDWLLTMPFVKQRSDGWYYHDVVRSRMIYYQRQRSPRSYRQHHTTLADFYGTSRREADLSEVECWTNKQWREDTLSYCYHYLLANPRKHWTEVVTIFALAVRKRRTFAFELIEMLSLDDVKNEISEDQTKYIQLFHQQLQAIRDGTTQDGFEMFDKLCQIQGLAPEARGHMLAYRAECYRLNGKWREALRDFNEALVYLPNDVRSLSRRGTTYILLRRFEEALTDLNQAIALDPNDAWANAVRGEAYRRIGRYEEALTDLDRAIALDEKHIWAIAMRGEAHRLLGRYEQALNDFNRAIDLDEKYSWAIARREETKLQIKREQKRKAIANENRADLSSPNPRIRLAPNEADAPTAGSFSGISVSPSAPSLPETWASPNSSPYANQPNIPTWQDYQQQAIPYIGTPRQASPPRNSHPAPAPMQVQPDTPNPLFTPNTPRLLAQGKSKQRIVVLLVLGLLIILMLLAALGFIFHIL